MTNAQCRFRHILPLKSEHGLEARILTRQVFPPKMNNQQDLLPRHVFPLRCEKGPVSNRRRWSASAPRALSSRTARTLRLLPAQ